MDKEHGDLYTLDAFLEEVNTRGLIDYDGAGYYSTEKKRSDKKAIPSEICKGNIDRSYSHVRWYNR